MGSPFRFDDERPSLGERMRSLVRGRPILLAIPVVVVAFVLFLVVGLASGGGSGDERAKPQGTPFDFAGLAAGTTTPQVEATLDPNRPTVVATRDPNAPVPGANTGDRMVIDKFGVNAPLSYKKVSDDGVMPNPTGPDDVAYYDFSTWAGLGGTPGSGGNSIFSGHVDSGRVACKNGTVPPPCTAVFWDINRLRVGDEIKVVLAGREYLYRVVSNQPLPADTTDWNKVVASTAQESITLITCGGDFNRDTRQYTDRQVVVAVKI